MRPRRPSAALLVALLALFVALGGPAAAQRTAERISGARLANNTVTGAKIRNGTLEPRDLSAAARRALRAPANGSVTAAKLAPNAVRSAAIRPNAVRAEEIAANAVGADEVAAGAVSGDELRDGAVSSADVADGRLRARDLSPHAGQAELDFPPLAPRSCAALPVNAPGDVNISDDVVAVTPPSNWPAGFPLTAALGPTHGRFTVVACNPTDAAGPDVGPINVRYIVFNL